MKKEKIVQEFRDQRSMELFGKPEFKLQIAERMKLNQYINDYNNPEWKRIRLNDTDTNYEVSNTGKIRNAITGKNLSLSTDKDGYLMAFIIVNHKVVGKGIHRFVSMTFIPNPDNKPQVNHINGNKQCNWVGNLEWVTCQENVIKAHEIGLCPDQRGANNNNSKYTKKDILNAIEYMNEHKSMTYDELSKNIGMSRTFLWNLKYGNRWGHLKIKMV